MATFIDTTRIGVGGTTVAVKDLIDIAGLSTTAGSPILARRGEPAPCDAACLAGLRAEVEAGTAQIVGKANLTEFAIGISGINVWFGTPLNPLDPTLIPGGSSSGSAVAVATGDAEVAYGTDTGGSVRIPAACCGVCGLKTTYGRIPLAGVIPASQALDTVGPLARGIDGLARGMQLLEPGFKPAAAPAGRIGRVRPPGVAPEIDAALDAALGEAGFEVVPVDLPSWSTAYEAAFTLIVSDLWRNNGDLVASDPDEVSEEVAHYVPLGAGYVGAEPRAREVQRAWQAELDRVFAEVALLALPTLSGFPPPRPEAESTASITCTAQFNLAGVPALAQPVRTAARSAVPASLQLVGPPGSEELLLASGVVVEQAAAALIDGR